MDTKDIDKLAEQNVDELMKAIIKIGNQLEKENRDVDEILKRVVRKWGNSAHIPIPSRYIDREAIIKILKKSEDKN